MPANAQCLTVIAGIKLMLFVLLL